MKKWNRTVTALILAVLFASVAAAAAGQEGVVNINTASAEQLTFLPRVGPALAGRIVEFRDSNGKFKATDELILVRGIGEGTYELLKPYVTIDGKTTLTEPVSPG
jgi:competence protein ComEA